MLNPSDYVGVTFWLLSAAMVAATFFFWVERDRAVGKWKTSLTVAAVLLLFTIFTCVVFGLILEVHLQYLDT